MGGGELTLTDRYITCCNTYIIAMLGLYNKNNSIKLLYI